MTPSKRCYCTMDEQAAWERQGYRFIYRDEKPEDIISRLESYVRAENAFQRNDINITVTCDGKKQGESIFSIEHANSQKAHEFMMSFMKNHH